MDINNNYVNNINNLNNSSVNVILQKKENQIDILLSDFNNLAIKYNNLLKENMDLKRELENSNK